MLKNSQDLSPIILIGTSLALGFAVDGKWTENHYRTDVVESAAVHLGREGYSRQCRITAVTLSRNRQLCLHQPEHLCDIQNNQAESDDIFNRMYLLLSTNFDILLQLLIGESENYHPQTLHMIGNSPPHGQRPAQFPGHLYSLTMLYRLM